MKNLLSLLLTLFVFGSNIFSQSKTYDIISYTPPSGWYITKKMDPRVYTIKDDAKGTYGLIGIYPAAASSGSAQKDFIITWNQLVMPYYGTGNAPVPAPVRKVDGYDELSGSSFGKSQGKQTTVRLVNYTGGGKTLSVIINYSDFKYEMSIEKFLKSIKLQSNDTVSVRKD